MIRKIFFLILVIFFLFFFKVEVKADYVACTDANLTNCILNKTTGIFNIIRTVVESYGGVCNKGQDNSIGNCGTSYCSSDSDGCCNGSVSPWSKNLQVKINKDAYTYAFVWASYQIVSLGDKCKDANGDKICDDEFLYSGNCTGQHNGDDNGVKYKICCGPGGIGTTDAVYSSSEDDGYDWIEASCPNGVYNPNTQSPLIKWYPQETCAPACSTTVNGHCGPPDSNNQCYYNRSTPTCSSGTVANVVNNGCGGNITWDCVGSTGGCSGPGTTDHCSHHVACTVNGGWSGYVCNQSTCTETRTCNNPSPACNGTACSGSATRACGYSEVIYGDGGSAVGQSFCNEPTTGLCSTPYGNYGMSFNDANQQWTWNCYGKDGTCPAVSGSIGPYTAFRTQSQCITANYCSNQWVQDTSVCNRGSCGIRGTKADINGVCGSAYPASPRTIVQLPPSGPGLCATTMTNPTPNLINSGTLWTWTCTGQCSGTNATCYAIQDTPGIPPPGTTFPPGVIPTVTIPPAATLPPTIIPIPPNQPPIIPPGIGVTVAVNSGITVPSIYVRNIVSNNNVPVETNTGVGVSGNHTCQDTFRNYGNIARFIVTYQDRQGGNDIAKIKLRIGPLEFVEENPIVNVGSSFATAIFEIGGTGLTGLQPILVSSEDVDPNVPIFWVNTGRYFKFWDCLVPINGTIYDSSGVPITNCGPLPLGFSKTIPPATNFTSLTFKNAASGDKSMSVTSPTYSSASNKLVWGKSYGYNFNTDILMDVDSNYMDFRKNKSDCIDHTFSMTYTTPEFNVNPYFFSVGITIDFTGVVDQDPWWQVENGGAISNTSITNRVPVTCYTPNCKASIGGLISSVSRENNNGLTNNNAFPWSYHGSGAKLANPNYSYDYFYNQYFVKKGIGITFDEDDKNMSDIGKTGVYFINGNLNIDVGKSIDETEFLMLVVKGDIDVSSNVNRVDGILVANNINVGGTSSDPNPNSLIFNGSLYAVNTIDLSRGFNRKRDNNIKPAVKVVYNPRMLFNLPGQISKSLTDWQWGN